MNPVKFISDHKAGSAVVAVTLVVVGLGIWKGPALYKQMKTRRSLKEKSRAVMEGPFPNEFIDKLNAFHATLNTDASKDDAFKPISSYEGNEEMTDAILRASVEIENMKLRDELSPSSGNGIYIIEEVKEGDKTEDMDAPKKDSMYRAKNGKWYPRFLDNYPEETLAEAMEDIAIRNGEAYDPKGPSKEIQSRLLKEATLEGKTGRYREVLEKTLYEVIPATIAAVENRMPTEAELAAEAEEAQWQFVPADKQHLAERQYIMQKLEVLEGRLDKQNVPESERPAIREEMIRNIGDAVWERWINWEGPEVGLTEKFIDAPEETKEPEIILEAKAKAPRKRSTPKPKE